MAGSDEKNWRLPSQEYLKLPPLYREGSEDERMFHELAELVKDMVKINYEDYNILILCLFFRTHPIKLELIFFDL